MLNIILFITGMNTYYCLLSSVSLEATLNAVVEGFASEEDEAMVGISKHKNTRLAYSQLLKLIKYRILVSTIIP